MTMRLLEPVSRVDQVTSAIRRAILTGQLEPGMPFKVTELAATFGVSIIPVREALQRLAVVGLVELRPLRMAVVSPLSADDLRDIYALRCLLEGTAIKASCMELTDEDLASLSDCLVAMAGHDDPRSDGFWVTHQSFHRLLLRPAYTPRLMHALGPLWEGTERYVRLVYDEIGFDQHGLPADVHRPILDAVVARNPTGAEKALVAHFKANLKWMLGGLSSVMSPKET